MSRSRRSRPVRLHLEALEERTLLAGTLDPTFHGNGSVEIILPNSNGSQSVAKSVAVQPNGRIVVVGEATSSISGTAAGILRLNSDGSPDTTFAQGAGEETLPFTPPETGGNLVVQIQADGKIVVAGSARATNGAQVALVRLNSDGSLDSSFGSNGEAVLTFTGANPGSAEVPTDLAVGSDGKIVIGATVTPQVTSIPNSYEILRLNPNGTPDATFGVGGKKTETTQVSHLAVQPDDKIVLVRTSSSSATTPFLSRLNADGSPDTTFQSSTSPSEFGGQAVALQSDGKILVAGIGIIFTTAPPSIPLCTRFNTDGTLDTSFGPGGTASVTTNVAALSVRSLVVDPDGKIVIAGQSFIVRLNPDGTPDATFGQNGVEAAPFVSGPTGATNVAVGLAVQSDSKLLFLENQQIPSSGGTQILSFLSRLTGAAAPVQSVGEFDPHSATWYLRSSNSAGSPDVGQFAYGATGWLPVVGDWDGNGTDTVGVVDPTTMTWYLRNENSAGGPDITPFQYGAPGWIPVVGDWNGSGKTGIGAVDPTTMTWYLRNSASAGAPDFTPFAYGAVGWKPVVGDWNGDGITSVGVVDPTTMTWYLRNENSAGGPDFTPFAYGAVGWKPVVGDWNGDLVTTIGVVDPSSSTWYLRNENSAGGPDFTPFAYGLGTWTPVAGLWTFGSGSTSALGGMDANTEAALLQALLLVSRKSPERSAGLLDPVFTGAAS